jgi:Phosphotransferase enzyme family
MLTTTLGVQINGSDVLVQSRISGVGLNVAWPYLSAKQKASFKDQSRDILRKLNAIRPPPEMKEPSYIVPDSNPVANRDIDPGEYEILFNNPKGSQASISTLSLMHNDLQTSNIIVKDDQIVGVVDWEQAGWFEWESAAAVHSPFRVPSRESFAQANLPKEKVDDLVFWSDLYTL